jgi:hypothetical protein
MEGEGEREGEGKEVEEEKEEEEKEETKKITISCINQLRTMYLYRGHLETKLDEVGVSVWQSVLTCAL